MRSGHRFHYHRKQGSEKRAERLARSLRKPALWTAFAFLMAGFALVLWG